MKQIFGRISGTYLFIMLQTILYGWFLSLDLTGGSYRLSAIIKYSMIILCFCYVLFYKKGTGKGILLCLRFALLFTVISDFFILLLDYYFYGVLSFLIVHQLYALKMDIEMEHKRILLTFLKRLCLQLIIAAGICLLLRGVGVTLERLLIVTVFYFVCIVMNVIYAVRVSLHRPKEKSSRIFAAGMILFLLCDVNVGIFNLSDFLTLSKTSYELLYLISAILMWTFYAPSQVLIALSVVKNQDKKPAK